MSEPLYRRAASVVHEVVDDRAMLISSDGVEIITLNPVGTIVWTALAEPTVRGQVVERLASVFPDQDRADIERDVQEFLDELATHGLVDVVD